MRRRAASPPSDPIRLKMVMEPQEQDLWCWAAVSVSVKKFYHSAFSMRQCEQANAQLNSTTCCVDAGSCNREWFLRSALEGLGVLHKLTEEPVALSVVADEIDAKRPVACWIQWEGGGGHFVCIDGYDGKQLFIKDPWYGGSRVPYDEFLDHYRGRGSWKWTYLTQP